MHVKLWKSEEGCSGYLLDCEVRPTLVHEEPADPAWAGVEVFVRAPHCEVDAPVVQREGDVPYAVRKIPPAHASLQQDNCQRCNFTA